MSVSAALMVLSLVLTSGILGRLTAMWIAAEMNRGSKPILHAVVKEKADAAEYVEEILGQEGLLIEMQGHVIIDRMCIWRRSEWFSWSTYIGLLAEPFDVIKLAANQFTHRRADTGVASLRVRAETKPVPTVQEITMEQV